VELPGHWPDPCAECMGHDEGTDTSWRSASKGTFNVKLCKLSYLDRNDRESDMGYCMISELTYSDEST